MLQQKMNEPMDIDYIRWYDDLRSTDVGVVGGKNASLGEMTSQLLAHGIPVPPGFATTSSAYWETLELGNMKNFIKEQIRLLETNKKELSEVGRCIRKALSQATLPDKLESAILKSYHELAKKCGEDDLSVAVRSSATAEDLPEASFAGQQETFLNVRGDREVIEYDPPTQSLSKSCKLCFASLFTDRAIVYRSHHGFDHFQVALSIGIQQMIRSDRGSAGVMFTIDTDTGFPDVTLINSSWGLGENVVQGTVSPDEYLVYKPSLMLPGTKPIMKKKLGKKEKTMVLARGPGRTTRNMETTKAKMNRFSLSDDDVILLARWGVIIEQHYSQRNGRPTPMDIEWAKDGLTNQLYVVQARPETVQARANSAEMVSYMLAKTDLPDPVVEGTSVGQKIVHGEVCVIHHVEDLSKFRAGCILVSEMTDPDWVPIMRQALGIVTDHGGRTCHAAIVSRELGIPAVVGTGNGTERLRNGQMVTLCCDGADVGRIYPGYVEFRREVVDLNDIPPTKTKVMLNLADPDSALRWWRLPIDGIGLARMEFTVTEHVKAHPMALAHPELVGSNKVRNEIMRMTSAYASPAEYCIETLGRGLGSLAMIANPKPVIIRMSDFKTNEYASLLGGEDFETPEENPMLGFRGASRYYSPKYRDGFALECKAIKYVRETLGLRNVIVMIPFCRTVAEADRVIQVLAEEGLNRGPDFQIYVMCEIPSNVILAEEFAKRFDGFSIGSNDLTQLTLGIDRDSEQLASLFDERDEAVMTLIRSVIKSAHAAEKKVGICGQAPSDHFGYAEMLVDAGIDSISLNPDSVLAVRQRLAKHESNVVEGKVVPKLQTPGVETRKAAAAQ